MEPREVCKICYNSTSHKPTPTLTYEPKNEEDEDTGEVTCSVCHQRWAPIRVAKELGSSRWVRIRPRPKLQIHIDFMMCKNVKIRNECPKGQECSFAHSQAELWAWNQERQKEPRPAPHINGSYQYQLCKYISKSGNCPYGVKCTFAHNEEELQSWLKVQGVVGGGLSSGTQSRSSVGSSSSYSSYSIGGIFKCNVCQLKCNSKKQLEDHINSSRHRQYYTGSGGGLSSGYSRQQTGTNPSRQYTRPSSGQTRPRPTLSFHITGFRLCVHVQNGRRCLYGDYCTFAHSQSELDEWNLQEQKSRAHQALVKEDIGNSLSRETASPTDQAVEKSVHMNNGAKMDFSSSIRAEVAKEHKDTVVGLEASKEGVTVCEVTDTELAVTTSSSSPISWVFEITTSVPHTLQSVLMFDPLNSDFDITYILRHHNGSWEKVPVVAEAEQGVGMLLCCKMAVASKLQVKVSVKPRSGLLGQLVIFQFGSFHILQCMVVRMMGENEEKLMKVKSSSMNRPSNIDLFWENHYSKIAMESSFIEDTDRHLPEYILPQQIETLIEKGKYSNVENRVTKENYKRRMHNLLYLEEYQQRLDLSRYDLYDVEVEVKDQYKNAMGGTSYAWDGNHFVTLSVDELLFEGGQSIRQGDSALLLPSNQQVVHECQVEHVGREDIVLKITEKAKLASASSRYRVSVRFVLGRVTMRSVHYAVDQLDLDTVFPEVQSTPSNAAIPSSPDVQKCLDVLKDSELNGFQLQAITSMLDPSCLKIPSLVLGPFGCGKTRTLSECIELLTLHMPKTCVLVCTHSNSAADIYVEGLDKKWSELDGQPPSLFRLYFTGRRLNTIPAAVQKYCKLQDGKLCVPSLAEMKTYNIVVATLSTARTLALMEMPRGHFSHIFIDEAAQSLESEALIPLSLANTDTKIVLAGDHMQLDPPVYSEIARKYGLHISLLERLYDLEAYESGVGQLCKTLLTENHRSHHLILELPSQLFYKNKLSCKAQFPSSGPVDLPAVKFVCVEGQEEQDEDSPSYYNAREAIQVAEEAKLLSDGGLRDQDICVLTYYSKQVNWTRRILRQKKLGQVQVHRVENVPGKEFRALIISTVRTSTESSLEKEAGFLTNPKLFNTAVTRARQWLVVVGEPVTLCTVGSNRSCWLEYIKRCIGLKSFQYPHPSQFIGSLDYKIVTRQLLERTHQNFFKSVVQKRPAAKTVSSPTSEQSTSEPSTFKGFVVQNSSSKDGTQQRFSSNVAVGVAHSPTVHEQASGVQDAKAFSSHFAHTFASKVQDTQPPPVKGAGLANRLSSHTSPSPKPLAVASAAAPFSNHSPLHSASPPTGRSSSPEPVLNHAPAPEAFLHDDILSVDDLPSSLRTLVEALSSYSMWCEHMLAASYPLKISSKVNDNLQRQKAILESQTKFLQEQIGLYRDYMKLRNSPKSVGQSNVSSTQQFHFPTALPPPPHPLNSAFTYDVANSYFSSDSNALVQAGSTTQTLKDKQLHLKGSGPSL